jgi:hypothetical protein
MIVEISLFVEIPQVIGCLISTIMGRAAMQLGQSGRNGHARIRREGGERQPQIHSGIALRNSGR